MLLLVFYSCDRNKKEAIDSIVKKWMGKEFLFPENSSFITYDNRDSVDFLSMKSDYRIVTYVNSETCFSCNLRLPFWKGFVMTTIYIISSSKYRAAITRKLLYLF